MILDLRGWRFGEGSVKVRGEMDPVQPYQGQTQLIVKAKAFKHKLIFWSNITKE